MHTTIQDLAYAFRSLAKARGFAAVAILTISLGIGANTAMFTVVNAVLLRPLPYAHPGRLVMVWQDLRARGGPADEWATPGNYADWRREPAIFQQVAVITGWRPTLTGGAEPEPISGEQVSHEVLLRARHLSRRRPRVDAGGRRPECAACCRRRSWALEAALRRRCLRRGPDGHAERRTARDRRRAAGGVPANRVWRGGDLATAAD